MKLYIRRDEQRLKKKVYNIIQGPKLTLVCSWSERSHFLSCCDHKTFAILTPDINIVKIADKIGLRETQVYKKYSYFTVWRIRPGYKVYLYFCCLPWWVKCSHTLETAGFASRQDTCDMPRAPTLQPLQYGISDDFFPCHDLTVWPHWLEAVSAVSQTMSPTWLRMMNNAVSKLEDWVTTPNNAVNELGGSRNSEAAHTA